MKKLDQRGFSHHMILVLVAMVVAVGGVGYYVWQKNKDGSNNKKSMASDSAPAESGDAEEIAEAACTAPANYLVYDNTDVRFCFVYPEEWGTTSVALGVVDVTNESGNGWLGTFSDESNASFAFLANDWVYTGPGRGGPNNATGFVTYEVFAPSAGDTTDYDIRINTADRQLVGSTSDFNIQGAIVWAKRVFVESEPYTGIEFQLNAPATGAFDIETAVVGDFVTAAQFEQMTTVLNSVTEY